MTELQRNVFEGEVEIPTLPLVCMKHFGFDIFHDGKNEHELDISFFVNPVKPKIIKFYILNNEQFESYALQNTNFLPSSFTYNEKTHKLENYKMPITKSTRIHFFFGNAGPHAAKIPIKLIIKERWIPTSEKLQPFSGIPFESEQLSKKIQDMINSSKKSLYIISPYTDLHLTESLKSSIDRGVKAKLIIRNVKDDQNITHSVKQALPYLQRLFQKNLKISKKLHARLIIKDEQEVLVMTSDLNQDSMHNLINCGMSSTDSVAVTQFITFFNDVWKTTNDPENS